MITTRTINRRIFLNLLIPLLLMGVSSCSNLKYLEEGQRLYTGSKIKIRVEEGRVPNRNEVHTELDAVLRPKPNERFLTFRTRLWFYNVAGENPRGPVRAWIKNTLGRPPVLWEQFDIERGATLMENRLFNMGFFDARIEYEPHIRERTASAEYRVYLKPGFIITELLPVNEESPVAAEINNSLQVSLVKPGRVYRLDHLREERERIATVLRDQGYFYFHPDFLLFRADTTAGHREVQLSLAIKENIPLVAVRQYRIRDIIVDANHTLGLGQQQQITDSVRSKQGMLIINNQRAYKKATLDRAIFFKQGELYNTHDHDLSINHLMGLGIFKFVNIRFTEVLERDTAWLDAHVLLNPMLIKTLGTEVRGVSKTNDFAGPGFNISFTHRNLLRGAEKFSINVDGSYEVLIGHNTSATNRELGITSEFTIPRFVGLGFLKYSPRYLPETRITFGINYLSRTDAFSLYSFRNTFGYHWNQSITTRHRFNPFVFHFFNLGTISPEYRQFFSREVLLRRGMFEQFLFGSEYSYFFNSQLRRDRRNDWFFNYNVDLSGNLLYLFTHVAGLGTPDENGTYGIFDQPYSQYAKTDFDVRYYFRINNRSRLASRFVAGIGVPYGNSDILPYVKLFVIGGSNSIRAFQPRSLGPGIYQSPDTLASAFDIYQSGEIKLEFNLEYRHEFTSIVKGALFIDAGNIWNIHERVGAVGGQFRTQDFLSQVAMGTGFGFRFDFTFFLLRLDLAFPLAVPYDASERYFQPFRPQTGDWRRQNLVFNLAIGYPF
jgi:outer membrane protein insertion porin family